MDGPAAEGLQQYLTFNLEQEVFALDIGKVREVLDYTTVTKVPRTPDFMCGVINLRGAVLPVVDLRLKFGMAAAETTVNTCIIIVEVSVEGEKTVIGAMADSVKEVIDLEAADIEPPPRIGTGFDVAFIRGMGKHGDGFIIILDMDRCFCAEEICEISSADCPATADVVNE